MTEIQILGAIAGVIGLIIAVIKIKIVREGLKWLTKRSISIITNPLVVSVIILSILSLNVYLAIKVFHIRQLVDTKRVIPIDVKNSGIYNAADDRKELYPDGGRIRATGQVHKYPETKNYISFSYSIIEGQPKTHDESSGAYLTFL